ncbi:hypothetical protein [Conexibacter sp. W3-3-2]|uniref:hypothetical protein n=1 Tax=Conexibacter sp. W3-3-2 TaxID=2675227 RepID=UPI0018AB081C|nr:hypothetical protein [Conexibacter sp. W3-3-2]
MPDGSSRNEASKPRSAGGSGSLPGPSTNGHSGEPWSTRLRVIHARPTTAPSATHGASVRAASGSSDARACHAAVPRASSSSGAGVVFVPTASPAATIAGPSSDGRRVDAAQSAAHTTAQVRAGRSVSGPPSCTATSGIVSSAAVATPVTSRSTPSARSPQTAARAASAQSIGDHTDIGTRLWVIPVIHASATSLVSG